MKKLRYNYEDAVYEYEVYKEQKKQKEAEQVKKKLEDHHE